MIRNRLRDMDMRITELSDYLKVSRPTMYKYIEFYDSAKFDQINKDILALFNYIEENELVGKRNVINYVLTNFSEVKKQECNNELYIISVIKNLLYNNPESKKSRFLNECFLNDAFNEIICYLSDLSLIINKKRLSLKEKEKLNFYKYIKKHIGEMED